MTSSVDIVIPKLGMTMQEGTLVEWLVADGATVSVGDPIFVLNTDKLDADIEAEAAGTLHHVAAPGQTLPTGGVIGTITTTAEDHPRSSVEPESAAVPAARSDGEGPAANGKQIASPNARRLSRELDVDLVGILGSGAGGRILGRDVEAVARIAGSPPGSPLPKVSFAARRAASTLGIDLDDVAAAAPGREITRQDVERVAAQMIGTHVTNGEARSEPVVGERAAGERAAGERMPLTGMRRVIAGRMHASLHEMAQLTIGMKARADSLISIRDELKSMWSRDGRPVPTFADFVAVAAARALLDHRALNAVLSDDYIELQPEVHIGMAVALDHGLVVPVVRDAHLLSLSGFAARAADLVDRARGGRLSVDDTSGATFSITSLGGLGVDFFTPVINPPNVAILGVGRIRDGVRFTKKGRAKPMREMTLSLTFDHRAVDGAPAAAFLRDVCRLLEEPVRLLQ